MSVCPGFPTGFPRIPPDSPQEGRILGIVGAPVRKRKMGAGGLMRGAEVGDFCASMPLSELIETPELGFGERARDGFVSSR